MNDELKDFELETRKLEARFERFLNEEGDLVRAMREFIHELKQVYEELKEMKAAGYEELPGSELRSRVLKAFNDVLLKKAEMEHEGSHLLESFGSVLLALDKALRPENKRT